MMCCQLRASHVTAEKGSRMLLPPGLVIARMRSNHVETAGDLQY